MFFPDNPFEKVGFQADIYIYKRKNIGIEFVVSNYLHVVLLLTEDIDLCPSYSITNIGFEVMVGDYF